MRTTPGKKVEIKPDADAPGVTTTLKRVTGRLTDIEKLTKAILWVGLISLVGIVVAVCALVIDQMHFNNQTYQDRSDGTGAQLDELNQKLDALGEQVKANKLQPQPATTPTE